MKKDITVLGIHDGHNSSAAIVKNGQVVAAIAEERLNNEKNSAGVPKKAISKVFDIAKINPQDIDLVSIAGLVRSHVPIKEQPLTAKLYEKYAYFFQFHPINSLLINFMSKHRKTSEILSILTDLGITNPEFQFIEHHLAHAASTYYSRKWDDDTLVLTLDGAGDGLCSTVNIGHNNHMQRIASTTAYNSPSNIFYSEVTGFLGLKRWEHEYKVMGMAPYGLAKYCMKEMESIVRVNPNKSLEFQNTIGGYLRYVQKKMRKLLVEQRFDNICAATQDHFENILVEWVQNAIKHTGIHKIACAGGSFLNVKANKRLRELPDVDQIMFYPGCGDEGVSIGAALEGYYRFCEREGIKPEKSKLESIYYGYEYNDDEIQTTLKNSKWNEKTTYEPNINEKVGQLLAKGKIIARFSGRDEFGPRALGNRSILSDARNLKIIRKINFAIKNRDFWMPFAPAILPEYMKKYFVNPHDSPYMIEAFDSNTIAEEDIAAGLHPKDNTGRPQTVLWNDSYYNIIKAFEKETSVGGILNTSFNLHGYPIVGTPDIALYTFENSALDGLILGNWLIMR